MVQADGWMHTGDVGYFDSDGHLYIVDRLKELIKYKGYQIAPAHLEGILLEHPAIADAAVIGVAGRGRRRDTEGIRGLAEPGDGRGDHELCRRQGRSARQGPCR